MRASRAIGAVLLGAACALASGRARAQEFGGGGGAVREGIGTRLGVESTWASFDLDGVRGSFAGVAARVDWRAGSRVDLRVLVPVYALTLDGAATQVGLGDSELRVRVLVYDAHPWRVFAGLADALPTGSTSIGVGQGAPQLTPFLTAGYRAGRIIVYVNAADALTLRPADKPALPDYVDPSTDHELHGTFGVIAEMGDHLYAVATGSGTVVLVPEHAGEALATAGLAVGVLPSSRFKLLAGAQLPVAGEHRFDVRATLAAYAYF
jgi:hypothetical protein